MAYAFRANKGLSKSLLQDSFTAESFTVTCSEDSFIESKRRPGLTQEQSTSFRQSFRPVPLLGTFSLRILGFLGSLTAAGLGLMSLCMTILTHPWNLLDNILLVIFSLAAAMVETTTFRFCSCWCCVRLRFKVEFWAKFLSRAWGKFIVYEMIGSLLLTRRAGGLVWIVVGIFNAVVGLLYFLYSIYSSRKLKAVRREAMRIYRRHFEDLFDEVDVNGDGYVSPREMDLLADKLGLSLSPNEIQVMMNYLDTDRDGKLNVTEFKVWFEQNKLPTLV